MTGVEVILAALAAGAGAGVSAAASTAVVDAYTGLRDALRRRLAGRTPAVDVLDADETDPGVWWARIGEDLADSGADQDEEILAAAHRVLELADPDGTRTGKYVVDAREAKGVQVGDGNIQHNTFS